MPGMRRLVAAKEQTDGVDSRTLHVLNAMDRIIQGKLRGVVIAIGNDDQRFPGTYRGSLHLVRGGHDRVVECRSTGEARM